MSDYKVTDTDLTSVANAIRTRGGTQAQLEWPTGFITAVGGIPSGGGGRDVPSSYQRVQYLSVTGDQWTDVPLVLSAGDCIRSSWEPTVSMSNESAFAGVEDYFEFYGASSKYRVWPTSDNYSYKFALIKDENWGVESVPVNTKAAYSVFVLKAGSRTTFRIGRYAADRFPFTGNFYGLSVLREIDGAYDAFRKYVPVYRKSDNKAGVFEIVTQVFYPSIGVSDFVAGPDVT